MESVGSSSVEGRLIGNEIKMRGDTFLKLASPSVIRRGLCMVRSPKGIRHNSAEEIKKQKKSVVSSVRSVAESVIKYGLEVATSHDPLSAAIEVGGKTGVGVSLSRFSASQCAGLIGVMVTSITPQASVPLLMKKISEDLDYLKESMDIVRENPQCMANELLSKAMNCLDNYKFDEALKHFEKANFEALRGIHMAPTFKGLLGCVQIMIFSSVMLECASSLDGINCFVPIHCLSEEAKMSVEKIIAGGLHTILKKAQTRQWNGKLKISLKTQNIIDPYLASLYNTYSLAASLTDPYQDCTRPIQEIVQFTIDTNFIPEGRNDSCKLEVLLHDDINIIIFAWKEFLGNGLRALMRHNRTTWNFDASHGSRFDISYHLSENKMLLDGSEMEKTVGWPSERIDICELMVEIKQKKNGKIKQLSRSTYKWMKQVPEQYLKCMDIDLDETDNKGRTLLHYLAKINDYKHMGCVMGKVKYIDAFDENNWTPLHKACSAGSFKAAKFLIKQGANVNNLTSNGDSPLMLLAKNKKHDLDLIKLLLEFNAKRHLENNDRMRAFDIATMSNAEEQVKQLLKPCKFI